MLEKRTEDYLESNERSVVHAGKNITKDFLGHILHSL
mgnify:CR=1 FL=1